ncbi:MAG: SMI1/KNR4 family protein [Turicibacter sp.]|nr:SMI1/KNR4 family protein [Turicibacter sp.]
MADIIKEIKLLNDFSPAKPVSNEEISKAENLLGLRFSAEYLNYLLAYGQADGSGKEFTGIINSERLNVVPVTKEAWEENPQVPKSLYVLENVGMDGLIIWQNSEGIIYQTSPKTSPKKIANSFVEYIQAYN